MHNLVLDYRVHQSLDVNAPDVISGDHPPLHAKLSNYFIDLTLQRTFFGPLGLSICHAHVPVIHSDSLNGNYSA